MTPKQDWTILDQMTETQAKMMLRMAVAHFRVINDSVHDSMKESSYSAEGHAMAAGFSKGFIVTWEDFYNSKQPTYKIEVG